MVDWSSVRAEFPALEKHTYLNTATYGLLPRRSVEAVTRHFERRNEFGCADHLDWYTDVDGIRQDIARLISADADDIAFIPNAATGLSWMLNGLDWQPGDHVLTLEDEFPNNLYAGAAGVDFSTTTWERLRESVTPQTRLVILSTVNYTTGFRPDIGELSKWLRERDVLLYVDGTQSLGAIRFDVREARPSMLSVHGYKWLLSPNGAGFAYVSHELRARMRPTTIGWRSDRGWRQVDALHHGLPRFDEKAERYEGGMVNFAGIYAMGESVRLMLDLGPTVIEERVLRLASQCRQVLTDAGGLVEHTNTAIVSARFPDVERLGATLREHGILVSARHGNLRVSVHFYNDEGDLRRLNTALTAVIS